MDIRTLKRKKILGILDMIYPEVSPPLSFSSPYTLLIAAMLSANSTDKITNKVTGKLFKIADTPEKMIKIPYKKLIEIIKPCGLGPTKAKNILKTSKMILEKYNGQVPSNMKKLMELPGVGRKVASVVMSQSFNKPAFPVDTHVARLAQRWKISLAKSREKIEEDCKKFFPKNLWNKVHLQMIYYGREYCKARGHSLSKCPICNELSKLEKKVNKLY